MSWGLAVGVEESKSRSLLAGISLRSVDRGLASRHLRLFDFSTLRLAAAFALATALAACGEASEPTTDAGVDAPADAGLDADAADSADQADVVELPPSMRFDLAAAQDDDFFAFPYPSDLRLGPSGAPDLASFPTQRGLGDLLERAVGLVETGSPGFSPLSAVYMAFEVDLDPETLPADVGATTNESASVYLIDVTPGSPTYGARHPVQVMYVGEGGGYWPPRTLVVHPLYGIPMRSATTYAAVVTDAVTEVGGGGLRAPRALREAVDPPADGPTDVVLTDSFRPLVDALLDLGEDPSRVVGATVFTTADPVAELVGLRDWMDESLEPPEAADVALFEARTGYAIYEGRFDGVEFFTGESPYRDFGEGRFELDASGAPVVHTAVDLTFTLSVPDGEMPQDGWPIVLFGHGLGENHRGFLRTVAGDLAARGVAVLGIDPPLQGDRNPTTQSDQDLIVGLAVGNIVAGREILRQGVFDEVRAAQLVRAGLTIPAGVSTTGEAVTFDADRMGFMGHSEGAQIGALLAAVEPDVGPFVFSAGGGGAAITMLELETSGIDVASVVATAVGIDTSVESFDLDHPVTTVVIQPLLDVADPLYTARHIVREPLKGLPHDLVMMEAFGDLLTPPASTEALASAIGLPIAEPVARPIVAADLQGIGSVALPAAANLPEVAGRRATGALLQFPDHDHYIIYFDPEIRGRLLDFLSSALAGAAEIPAAP